MSYARKVLLMCRWRKRIWKISNLQSHKKFIKNRKVLFTWIQEDNIKIINLTKPKNSLLKLSKSFRKEADQKRWIHLASLQTLVLLWKVEKFTLHISNSILPKNIMNISFQTLILKSKPNKLHFLNTLSFKEAQKRMLARCLKKYLSNKMEGTSKLEAKQISSMTKPMNPR